MLTQVLGALKQALKSAADVIKWGAGIQESTRTSLVTELQGICKRVDEAYDAVLARLVAVKNAYGDPKQLAKELREFAADSTTRRQFKPEQLCGQVDFLLAQLSSNLNPLKYSIDLRHIQGVRQYLQQFGNFDGAIFESYDEFTKDLDQLATEIQDSRFDAQERAMYARHVVDGFMDELLATQAEVGALKTKVIGTI